MRDGLAVAAHAVLAAVEDGRFRDGIVFAPIPVLYTLLERRTFSENEVKD